MKRFAAIPILLILVLAVSGCTAGPKEIVIFHTNDLHGRFLPEVATWHRDGVMIGGMCALSYHLAELRATHPHSIYLDAGDLMTGNPICNLTYNGVEGGALQEMLHRLGADAMCLGNHEFDLGPDHLRDFVAASPVPIVCANLREKDGNLPLAPSHRVIERNGVKIGVIGLLMENLSGSVARPCAEPFAVGDPTIAAQAQIDELDPSTDLIVLLTHMGVDEDSVLATKIQRADVMVGGHSHTRLETSMRVNGILIVQAGAYGQNLGMLELQVGGDSVVTSHGRLIELTQPATRPADPVTVLADSFEVIIHQQYGQVIGDLEEAWVHSYYTGSNAGNWICDRLLRRYKADVALVNAGGLRKDVTPGPVTMLDVLELIPFVNRVVTFNSTGRELLSMALEQGRAQGLHAHGALEMSGMTVSYAKRGSEIEIKDARIHGMSIEPERSYRVVSIDYVAVSQADKYLGFVVPDPELTSEMLSDVVMDEIKNTKGPIKADSGVRLKEVP